MLPTVIARRLPAVKGAGRLPKAPIITKGLPCRCLTIQAPGPSNSERPTKRNTRQRRIRDPDPGPTNAQSSSAATIDASPADAFRIQHPYASVEPSESLPDPEQINPPESSTTPAPHTSLPSPPAAVPVRPLYLQHPFDTHAFVAYLEKHDVSPGTSVILMESVRRFIVRRGERARDLMLSKEDMENGAYLFRAALNELRTELSVRTRNDGTALKAMSSAIRREVDQLEQKLKEDVQTLKHDIEMDMNNRKADTKADMKGFDMSIEEINNKFTISLGDLRTEIESAKWDSVRRAISIIVVVVLFGVGTSIYYAPPNNPPPATVVPVKAASPPPAMREMSVGTDDELMGDEAVVTISEERLEKLLRDKGVGEIAVGKPKAKKVEKEELMVDRI